MACTVLLGAATALAVFGPSRHVVWASPLALFVIVTIAASLCVFAAAAVIVAGHRRDLAEVGLLGTGLLVVSILPLVHGLTAPGVLYGPNQAVMTSAFLALPMALGAWSPLALRRRPLGAWAARRWRVWCAAWTVLATGLAVALLVKPQITVVPTGTPAWIVATVVAQVTFMTVLSRQQLGHYELSRRGSALVASLALVLLAASVLVWLGTPVFSVGWWLVHGLDIAGVLGGCAGADRGHRLGRTTTEVLAPVLARPPGRAEVGLSPVVHRFRGRARDEGPDHPRSRRAHRCPGRPCRAASGDVSQAAPHLGLGALLHDIGKLETPDELLNKPERLTPDEFLTIQRHTVVGDALVRTVPALVPMRRSCVATTNGWTARGTPTGCRASRSRWRRGSSPRATCSMPWPTPASTARAWAASEPRRSCANTPAASGMRRSSNTSSRSAAASRGEFRRSRWLVARWCATAPMRCPMPFDASSPSTTERFAFANESPLEHPSGATVVHVGTTYWPRFLTGGGPFRVDARRATEARLFGPVSAVTGGAECAEDQAGSPGMPALAEAPRVPQIPNRARRPPRKA